mmetsp:Transcript_49215/g.130331  ORF Transcript_49215/g.130331 Transcript_49215/m.130331 type:complete len:220 (+) Transcript_49215:826-1485(+)
MQRSVARVERLADGRAQLQQGHEHIPVSLLGAEMQWSPAFHGFVGNTHARSHQVRHCLCVPTLGREVQRREAVPRPHVDCCECSEERRDDVGVASPRCQMERREFVCCSFADWSTCSYQEHDHFVVSPVHREVQSRHVVMSLFVHGYFLQKHCHGAGVPVLGSEMHSRASRAGALRGNCTSVEQDFQGLHVTILSSNMDWTVPLVGLLGQRNPHAQQHG